MTAVLPERRDEEYRGVLEVVNDGEHVMCEECRAPCRALGIHVWKAHQMTAAAYRARHDLPPDTTLTAPATKRRCPSRTAQ